MIDDLLYSDLEDWKYYQAEEFEKKSVNAFQTILSRVVTIADSCDYSTDPIHGKIVKSFFRHAVEVFNRVLPRLVALFEV